MGLVGKKCEYCKKSIPKVATFCPHCGKEQNDVSKSAKISKEERGYICPHCGGDFKVFSCLCPHCGKEQIGQIRSKSILQFTQELQRLDEKKSKTGVLAVLNSKKIKNLEEQKLNYIQTFIVPNAKEDVLEFMVLASSNFNPYILMAERSEEVNLKAKEFQKQRMIAQAWHTKMEQVYKKAQAAFGQDEDFSVIKNIYDEKEQIVTRLNEEKLLKKKKQKILFGAMGIGWVALLIMCLVLGGEGKNVTDDAKSSISETEAQDEVVAVVPERTILTPIETEDDNTEEEMVRDIPERKVVEDQEEDIKIEFVEEIIENKGQEENEVKEKYTFSELSETLYASQKANVRDLPEKLGKQVGTIAFNQEVLVTGVCDQTKWYRIDFNGSVGYVSDSLLSKEKKVEVAQEVPVIEETVIVQETTVEKATPIVEAPSSSGGNTSGGGDSVVVPKYEDIQGNLVWVPTNGGKRYHSKSSCSNMDNPMQVTVEHAEANGYTPCKRCY